jgi:hypothetical protein
MDLSVIILGLFIACAAGIPATYFLLFVPERAKAKKLQQYFSFLPGSVKSVSYCPFFEGTYEGLAFKFYPFKQKTENAPPRIVVSFKQPSFFSLEAWRRSSKLHFFSVRPAVETSDAIFAKDIVVHSSEKEKTGTLLADPAVRKAIRSLLLFRNFDLAAISDPREKILRSVTRITHAAVFVNAKEIQLVMEGLFYESLRENEIRELLENLYVIARKCRAMSAA